MLSAKFPADEFWPKTFGIICYAYDAKLYFIYQFLRWSNFCKWNTPFISVHHERTYVSNHSHTKRAPNTKRHVSFSSRPPLISPFGLTFSFVDQPGAPVARCRVAHFHSPGILTFNNKSKNLPKQNCIAYISCSFNSMCFCVQQTNKQTNKQVDHCPTDTTIPVYFVYCKGRACCSSSAPSSGLYMTP